MQPDSISEYDVARYSGSPYAYSFTELRRTASEAEVRGYCEQTRRRFAPIAKAFDDALNTQWFVRHYLAVKYLLASSVMLGSAAYSRQHNVQLVVPYCSYYALLLCCRAYLHTAPDQAWRGRATIAMTHQATLNNTSNYLRRLRSDAEAHWGRLLKAAQSQRELFSYKFPGTGRRLLGDDEVQFDRVVAMCRLLADLAQLNSDCLETALRKHAHGTFQLLDNEDLNLAMYYDIEGADRLDSDDALRLDRFARGGGKVSNLHLMATDGLTEDFFGAWHSEDGGGFDPDDCMDLLITG